MERQSSSSSVRTDSSRQSDASKLDAGNRDISKMSSPYRSGVRKAFHGLKIHRLLSPSSVNSTNSQISADKAFKNANTSIPIDSAPSSSGSIYTDDITYISKICPVTPVSKIFDITQPVDDPRFDAGPLFAQGASPRINPKEMKKTCVFCEMNLDVCFSSESVEVLACQHLVHSHCLKDLGRIASGYGEELLCPECREPAVTQESIINPNANTFEDDVLVKTMKPAKLDDSPFGGVDSESLPAPRRDLSYKMSNLSLQTPNSRGSSVASPAISTRAMSPLIIPFTSTSASPNTDNRSSGSTFATRRSYGSTDSYGSTRTSADAGVLHPDEINAFYRSEVAETVFCGDCSTPIRVIGRAELQTSKYINSIEGLDRVYRVFIGLQVGKSHLGKDILPYRATPKDITEALRIKKDLDTLEFHQTTLRSLSLGLLRFYSKVQVTSPKSAAINWVCTAYLFEEFIVIVSGKKVVKAVLDVRRGIDRAYMVPDTQDPVFQIDFTENTLPPLRVQVSCEGLALLWLAGISDRHQQFPLSPSKEFLDDCAQRIEKLQSPNTTIRAPTETVLCLPFKREHELSLQQAVSETLVKLRSCDRLGLVIYSCSGILKTVPLRRPDHTDWDNIIAGVTDSLPQKSDNTSSRSDNTPVYKLNQVLETAGDILRSHELGSISASVLLVSDGPAHCTSLPATFSQNHVRVHTFGYGESHDPLPLSAISSPTGGTYVYAKNSDDLNTYLRNTAFLETQYVLNDVKMLVKPRIGSAIINAHGSDVQFDAEKRSLELNIGRLRVRDTRTYVFDVKGTAPTGQSLLQVLLRASNVTVNDQWPFTRKTSSASINAGEQACNNMHCFRIEAPIANNPPNQSVLCLLQIEDWICRAHNILEDAVYALRINSMRNAYNCLSAGIEECKENSQHISKVDSIDVMSSDSEGNECSKLLSSVNYVLQLTFDKYCDAIMEKTMSITTLMLKMLHDLWLLDKRRSVARHSSLENMFFNVI